jgi:transcriptional regulator with XRE-family HTH domain
VPAQKSSKLRIAATSGGAGQIAEAALSPAEIDHYDAFHFGERLRAFRKQQKLSLERAAELVGVPASTLSRIENRKMSPTLDLILKIVRAMNLHPYDVLGRQSLGVRGGGEISVTRKGAGEYTELPNILYAPLHPDISNSAIRPIMVTLFARSVEEYGGLTAHSGEEFLFVLHGAVEVHFGDGAGRVDRLAEGDSIYFDSQIPHAYVAMGNAQAKMLIVASTLDPPFMGRAGK